MNEKVPGRHLRFGWADAERLAFLLQLICLSAGAILHFTAFDSFKSTLWMAAAAVAVTILLVEISRNVLRGNFALDVIAAAAMLGALLLGEALAAIIIATMYLGGQVIEDIAHRRVGREMNALLARVPRTASRYVDDHLEEIAVSLVRPGDRLLVRRGEVVPADGTLLSDAAVLDQSSLTGEALPVRMPKGGALLSGVTNAADSFNMLAAKTSADSTYAGVVRLVENAQSSRSPFMALADRYAILFLVFTIVVCTAAWILSDDPQRALAVLVVATPCPLILAVPIAILSGVSRSARRGILIKSGAILEELAQAEVLLFDKTGTLTDGRARLLDIKAFGSHDPHAVLGLAASLDQGSHHVMAQAIVRAAQERGLPLRTPHNLKEEPGSGIEGSVDNRRVALGTADFIAARHGDPQRLAEMNAGARSKGVDVVAVTIDGEVAGGLFMGDRIRPEAPTVLRTVRELGIRRVLLLTGDSAAAAANIAATLGIDDFRSDMKPADKIAAVEAEKRTARVIMVGDGINDAPALAAANVGVAMGARGAVASSEAADVVLLVDRLDRLVTALHIARRSKTIAKQSAIAGILLSAIAMLVAAVGYLPPIEGALLQEAIDIAVIFNALRALGGSFRLGGGRLASEELSRLENEHRQLADIIDEIGDAADKVTELPAGDLLDRLRRLNLLLADGLLKHERRDEKELFPRLRKTFGQKPLFTGLSRAHMEIQRRAQILSALAESLSPDPTPMERRDIQRLLDGLEAITTLHFDEEDEIYRLLEAG